MTLHLLVSPYNHLLQLLLLTTYLLLILLHQLLNPLLYRQAYQLLQTTHIRLRHHQLLLLGGRRLASGVVHSQILIDHHVQVFNGGE